MWDKRPPPPGPGRRANSAERAAVHRDEADAALGDDERHAYAASIDTNHSHRAGLIAAEPRARQTRFLAAAVGARFFGAGGPREDLDGTVGGRRLAGRLHAGAATAVPAAS